MQLLNELGPAPDALARKDNAVIKLNLIRYGTVYCVVCKRQEYLLFTLAQNNPLIIMTSFFFFFCSRWDLDTIEQIVQEGVIDDGEAPVGTNQKKNPKLQESKKKQKTTQRLIFEFYSILSLQHNNV